MSTAYLHFRGELASLTGGERVLYPLSRRASIKDVLEALGVPHTEIYSLAVNGQPAGFGHVLAPADQVVAAPGRPPVDPLSDQLLRPALPAIRFLADANVGRLATYLRVLGFDTAYDNHSPDDSVAKTASAENRILLTRDKALLRRKLIVWGRLIRANEPVEQARDIALFFGLAPLAAPFSRCVRCNLPLQPVPKSEVLHLLEPRTKRYYETFFNCTSCGRVYWAGSHHDRMEEMVRRILQD